MSAKSIVEFAEINSVYHVTVDGKIIGQVLPFSDGAVWQQFDNAVLLTEGEIRRISDFMYEIGELDDDE